MKPETRNDIAHGAGAVDIGKVASVAASLDVIRHVAHRFLNDWRRKFLYVSHRPEQQCVEDREGG
jgi:hypothetical protein